MPREPKPATDPYAVLGLEPGASTADARHAYYRLARQLHPDHHPDASAGERARLERAMVALNLAWASIEGGGPEPQPEPGPERRARADTTVVPPGFARDWRWRSDGGLRLTASGAALAGLRGPAAAGVTSLDLNGRAVVDGHLALADHLPMLRRVDLSRTKVTDAGLAALAGRDPSIRDLDLSGTAVTDAGLVALAGLPTLHSLVLVDTAVTDAGLAALGRIASLAILNLRGTAVRGDGLHHLAALPRLRLLSLPHVHRAARRALAAERPDVEIV